jgi:hypothetical protein
MNKHTLIPVSFHTTHRAHRTLSQLHHQPLRIQAVEGKEVVERGIPPTQHLQHLLRNEPAQDGTRRHDLQAQGTGNAKYRLIREKGWVHLVVAEEVVVLEREEGRIITRGYGATALASLEGPNHWGVEGMRGAMHRD